MRARVLIDNLAGDGFIGEWGLSIWIEYAGHKLLLDAGTSGAFAENARSMGLGLEEVEWGVLSHAHYDHSDGLETFFAANASAKIYLRSGTKENCYGFKEGAYRYIGVKKGLLAEYAQRFVYADGNYELLPGAWLIPHSSPDLERIAARSALYVRRGERMVPDDFRHEQSLVLETPNGLVVFNSCSHAGPDNIVHEVASAFPGRKICALIGGLHLYKLNDDEVRAVARKLKSCGIDRVYTGHCTGERGYELLREELGEGVMQLCTGLEIEV